MKKICLLLSLILILVLAGCAAPQSEVGRAPAASSPLVAATPEPILIPYTDAPNTSAAPDDSAQENKAAGNAAATLAPDFAATAMPDQTGADKPKGGGQTPKPVAPTATQKPSATPAATESIKEPEPEKTPSTVYWTPGGKVYHSTDGCRTLARSKIIHNGTASQSGKARGCKVCFG